MNRYASVFVFLILVVSAAAGSIGNYYAAKKNVVDTLNTALQRTIAENKATWLTQDTIANYRRIQKHVDTPLSFQMYDDGMCKFMSNGMADALRGKTYVELRLTGQSEKFSGEDYLCSDTIFLTNLVADDKQNVGIAVRGIAQCSMATIFAISDQRLPVVLFLLSVSWVVFAYRRKNFFMPCLSQSSIIASEQMYDDAQVQGIGGIIFRNEAFFDNKGQEIHLTPMQRQLLTMFFNSPDHKLLQADICNRLWPKKDDASETLYALITRTKKVIEQRCGIKIEVDRGRGYTLISNK